MAKRTLSPRPFTLLPDPPLAYAQVLIDDRLPVITLVRAFAKAGLRLTYSPERRSLVIEALSS